MQCTPGKHNAQTANLVPSRTRTLERLKPLKHCWGQQRAPGNSDPLTDKGPRNIRILWRPLWYHKDEDLRQAFFLIILSTSKDFFAFEAIYFFALWSCATNYDTLFQTKWQCRGSVPSKKFIITWSLGHVFWCVDLLTFYPSIPFVNSEGGGWGMSKANLQGGPFHWV